MIAKVADMLAAPFDSLSRAAAPILEGIIRRRLLARGVAQEAVTLCGARVNYYRLAARRRSGWLRRRAGRGASGGSPPVPILLVHGLADNALTWALTLGSLARDSDVYAVDLPGYGFSSLPPGQEYAPLSQICEVLQGFIREVIGRPALVVGNSMGGWLAVRLAQAAPELVRGIVLINPGGATLDGRASWEPFRELVALPDLRTTRLAMRQVLGFIPAPLIYFAQRGIQERFQQKAVRAFVAAAAEDDFITAEELRRLRVPVSLIWGRRDQFLPRGSLAFFRENLPGAELLLIERCGHLPQRERPFTVARFIRSQASALAVFHLHLSAAVLQ